MICNRKYHWNRKETAFIYVSSIPRDVATASFLYGLTAPICMVCLFSEMNGKTLREVDFSDKE